MNRASTDAAPRGRSARKTVAPSAARTGTAFAVILALLLGVVVLSLVELGRIDAADATVRALTNLHALAADLRDQSGDEEIGVRGFVETGNLTFLHLAQHARSAVASDVDRLAVAGRADAGLARATAQSRLSGRAMQRVLDEQIALGRGGRGSEAIARLELSDDTFELYLRDLRAISAHLSDEIAEAARARRRIGEKARISVILSGLLALALSGALFVFVKRGTAIERSALRDPLTGLANRTALQGYLRRLVAQRETTRERFALLFIDLDGFKAVNDGFGHAAGDVVLIEAAARMRRSLRPHDFVARSGGDEFMVLLPQVGHRFLAERLADRVRDRIGLPIAIGDRLTEVGASIGIAMWPDDAATAPDLIAHGDAAMYSVKRARTSAERKEPHPRRRADDVEKVRLGRSTG